MRRKPDYLGDGVAVWVNYDKNGVEYLSIKIGDKTYRAFKHPYPQNSTPYFVYIWEGERGSRKNRGERIFYTGITRNLERRWKQHCGHRSKYPRINKINPRKIVYVEIVYSKKEAESREKQLKKLTVAEKIRLIEEKGKPDGYTWDEIVELTRSRMKG